MSEIPEPTTAPNQPPAQSNRNPLVLIVIAIVGVVILAPICCVLMSALMLPALSNMKASAEKTETLYNAKQLGLAINAYRTTHGRYPSAVEFSKDHPDAKHSWRTSILAHLEQSNVRDQIDIERNWDDPANVFLSDVSVEVFKSGRAIDSRESSTTHFVAVVDKDTVMPSDGRRVRAREVQDGLTKTIMLIEFHDSDISWYQPKDIAVEQAITIIKNQKAKDGTVVVFADGTPFMMPSSIEEQHLRALFTRRGKEKIPDQYLPVYE